MPMPLFDAHGYPMPCGRCGMTFHRKGADGLMDKTMHICQPMVLGNYTNDWSPFTVSTPAGHSIEYRWVCEVKGTT